MTNDSEILIISGTNRTEAVSLQLSKIYAQLLIKAGVPNQIIDLRELPNDFIFSALYEHSGSNTEFNGLRSKMAAAGKFVFIVPEYNGSFPGVLKAFVDGLEFPNTFRGKKCALVGLSAGIQGAGLALSHLTDIFNYCGMHVLARKPKFANIDKSLSNGELTNQSYTDQLNKQVNEFLQF